MRPLRSFLFVPGDNERKLAKADGAGADALILDLEDAVSSANKPLARQLVPAFLIARPKLKRRTQVWVRINPLETEFALQDLIAIVPAQPDGLVLPKANGPEDVRKLSHYLDALEAQGGMKAGSISILPVATETAVAPFRLGDYSSAGLQRLWGLTWGAEDLSAAIGASTSLDAAGRWASTYQIVRSLMLLAARAAGIEPIDTLYGNYRDEEGLRASSRASCAEGFTGRLAIHPSQIQAINESYLPSSEEIGHAHRVIAAFDASPGAGTVGLDGRMLDKPHLRQAQSVLARAAAFCR